MKTKRMKIMGLLLSIIMLVSMLSVFSITAFAAESIPYIDANGNQQTQASATEVTSSTTTWSSGWYVVNSDVAIGSRINVSGDVHLILTDGCLLIANAGIGVNSGNSLTIYGQSAGTGKVTANATAVGDAGIGGNSGFANGNITINGGNITSKGQSISGTNGGAGIGGGNGGKGSYIIINGGNITAEGAAGGAGIGGGNGNEGVDIIINGGSVIARGGWHGAGIGGGYQYSGSNITISGGSVTATGGGDAAGIGGGMQANGNNITINGGTVIASSSRNGSGIGGGVDAIGEAITISDGKSEADADGDGIYEDASGTKYFSVPNGYSMLQATVTMSDISVYYKNLNEALTAVSTATAADNAVVKLEVDINGTIYVSGGVFTFDLNGHSVQGNDYGLHISNATVTLIDSNENGSVTATGNAVAAFGGNLLIEDGIITSTNSRGVEIQDDCVLTITGGAITGAERGVVAYGGTMTITGGIIEATGAEGIGVESNSCDAVITGGSISGNTDISGNLVLTLADGKTTGTEFPGGLVGGWHLNSYLGEGMAFGQGDTTIVLSEGQTEITGGDVTVVHLCVMDSATGYCKHNCGKQMAEVAVTVSGSTVYYEDMTVALAAVRTATEADNAVVRLERDIIGKTAHIDGGVFTFDLNKHTLVGETDGIYITNATVTVTNGNINGTSEGVLVNNGATLKMINCSAVGAYTGIQALGATVSIEQSTATGYVGLLAAGGSVHVVDSTFTGLNDLTFGSESIGIAAQDNAVVVIERSTSKGNKRGVFVDSSELTVTGSTLEGISGDGIFAQNNSVITVHGGTIIGAERGISGVYGCTVTINGGTVRAVQYAVGVTLSTLNITGGTISGDGFDLLQFDSTITLTVGDGKTEGATFPDGINAENVNLHAILGEGMAFWQGDKMIVLSEGQTEITGGDVIVGLYSDTDGDGIYEDANGNLYVPDQDGDGSPEKVTDTDGDGIYEDANGNLYIPDQNDDGIAEKVTDTDADGIYEDEEGTKYISDQNGDGQPEADTNGDGIYEDANGNLYIPDQNSDGKPEAITDADGDGIYEDANGNLYIPDQNGDGLPEKVTDTDNDGVYEDENGGFYLPDGNGNITKLTDTNNDGIYEDASGKKYITAAGVEKLKQELEEAVADLEEKIAAQVDPTELAAEIKKVTDLIEALDSTYATDGEVADLKSEMEEKLNELTERVTALENRTITFKVDNGNLYVRYDEDEEWVLIGAVQGADGKNGQDGADGKTPTFKIENGELKVSYDNGETWTSLGNIQGAAGANGADGEDGKDGTNGSKGKDGEDGKDGITPQLRINSETNEWEVSYDNGTTWASLGVKATGDKGDKGDKGDTGAAGADGKDGINGKDGVDGKDGAEGKDGANGLTVAATIIGSTALVSNISLIAYALIKKKRLF